MSLWCAPCSAASRGEAELHLGAHSIHASAIAREDRGRVISCPVYSLDQLVGDGAIPPPDVIKIDVEGAEMLVFAGAREVLRKHRPAIVFEADDNLARFGQKPSDVMNFLKEVADYRIYAIIEEPLQLKAVTDLDHGDVRNFVALAPGTPVPELT